MSVRTTVEKVKGILVDEYDSQREGGPPSLEPYILTASVLVDRLAAAATSLTATELELIERWLSAHFYKCMDPAYSQRSTQSASGTFQGQTGMGLDSSRFGPVAKMLDHTGTLSTWDTGGSAAQVIEASWLGKPPSQQIPYWDRA